MKQLKELFVGATMVQTERQLLRNQRVIMLADQIDEVAAFDFVQDAILLSGETEPVRIIIASNGGNIEDGLAIMRAIRELQRKGIKVIGEVHGRAMSAAFLILQCCDERTMGKPDVLMAHGLTTFAIGDMRNLDAESKLLKHWQKYFAEMLTNRCKGEYAKQEFWMEIMEDNTPRFYSSEESLNMGLCDRIE